MNIFLQCVIIFGFMFLWYIIVMPVHEFGHWLAFKYYRLNPKIRWSLVKDIEIGFNLHKKVKLKEALIIALAGILIGAIPVKLINLFLPISLNWFTLIAYIFLCFGDIYLMMQIIQHKNWNISLYDLNKKLWKEYNKQVDKKNGSNG